MAALEDVGLRPAKLGTRIVSLGEQFGKLRLRRAAVVAREDDECVVSHTVSIQRVEHLAHAGVSFHDEVGVRIQTAFALPFLARRNGRVRGIERDVEKERPS